MPDEPFEIVDHTADWALHVSAPDLPSLFVNAAKGMNSLLVKDVTAVPLAVEREVVLDADDAEDLLVAWLGELVYWAEIEQLIMHAFDLQEVSTTTLRGTVRGGMVPEMEKHIKAVTYNDLAIRPVPGGLDVTIVFDV